MDDLYLDTDDFSLKANNQFTVKSLLNSTVLVISLLGAVVNANVSPEGDKHLE